MEKKISYRVPEGFNPHTCMDTTVGSPTPSTTA